MYELSIRCESDPEGTTYPQRYADITSVLSAAKLHLESWNTDKSDMMIEIGIRRVEE